MKTYKRIKGSKLEKTLKNVIAQHERFKNSYFWTPPQNASGRRQMEKRESREPISFAYGGKKYEIKQAVDCSCKNVYYNFSVHVDDKKKDVRAIRALI